MIVLAGTVGGHGSHDLSRHVQHAFADLIGNIAVRLWPFLLGGEFLKPLILAGDPKSAHQ